jgi:lipopolysaccharide biosynthesis protein
MLPPMDAAAPVDLPRLIAFYLPQFHPVRENDEWWGAGFTEWRNVAKARPAFPGHYQPHLPGELGFYDLRLAETRQAQADLARAYGVHGFCYYHYWFNGRRILERPFNEVLASGEPDFPFALCWANENWTRVWDGGADQVLLGQDYSDEDDLAHIRSLLPAFADPRYIRVDGKPLFLVYRAGRMPDPRRTTDIWRAEAAREGLGELYLCKVEGFEEDRGRPPRDGGFDASVGWIPDWGTLGEPLRRSVPWRTAAKLGLASRGYREHRVFEYSDVVRRMLADPAPSYPQHPCVTPSWDNSARRKEAALILRGATPDLYEEWLTEVVRRVVASDMAEPLVFVNAWNEWAEGNHLEPDVAFGRAWLEATRRALDTGRAVPRP